MVKTLLVGLLIIVAVMLLITAATAFALLLGKWMGTGMYGEVAIVSACVAALIVFSIMMGVNM